MKKILLISTLVCLSLLFPSLVDAHRERLDGWITGKLHIDPDDDPFIGKDAQFHLHLSDERKKFIPENCLCEVTVLQGDRPVFSQTLVPITTAPVSDIDEQFNFNYTFPAYGQYFVQVRGTPKKGNSFSQFFLNFDLLVERADVPMAPTQTLIPLATTVPIQGSFETNQNKLFINLVVFVAFGGIFAIVSMTFLQKKQNIKREDSNL